MITIIADDKIPFLKGALEPFASIRYMAGGKINHEAVEQADAMLIRTRTICNESLLSGSRVKFIATATIGFDHIATDYCAANSIHWTNAPGCNAASVQQYIASVLATLARRNNFSLAGKILGIVGVGHVGKKVETLARLFGMKVLLNDPPRSRSEGDSAFVPLEQILAESDIVTLHVPLNRTGEDKTFHLINETTFGFIKPDAWLINSSRGEVVKSEALKSALANGRLSGAVLDVWENEPSVDEQLLEKVTIATPHIAGYSTDGKRNGTVKVVRSLGKYFNFPVDNWEPSSLPEPENPVIILDFLNNPLEKLVNHAILSTYDVTGDDFRFRSNHGEFEKLRGNYPVRREFPAFKISLSAHSAPLKAILQELGFSFV